MPLQKKNRNPQTKVRDNKRNTETRERQMRRRQTERKNAILPITNYLKCECIKLIHQNTYSKSN